jgi:hypothetical protein
MHRLPPPQSERFVERHLKQPTLQRFGPGRVPQFGRFRETGLQHFVRPIRIPEHTEQKPAQFLRVLVV